MIERDYSHRIVLVLLLFGITLICFWRTLAELLRFSLNREDASHILLIPFVSTFLLYVDRRRIFLKGDRVYWWGGTIPVMLGAAIAAIAWQFSSQLTGDDYISSSTAAMLLVWIGSFIFCFGPGPARRAIFPLAFLLLMVPIPDFLLAKTIYSLQVASSDVAYVLFSLLHVPVYRQGFVFALPGLSIEVAQECSGIRSSLGLVITSVLASHWLLDKNWKRVLFVSLAIPVAILKNGMRIVTLSLLSIYVNPRFMYGTLHTEGGILFFALGLLLLYPALRLLETLTYAKVQSCILPDRVGSRR